MAYPKKVKGLIESIPKEHHKNLHKIMEFYYNLGVQEIQDLLYSIYEIPPKEIKEYCVIHESELDGG